MTLSAELRERGIGLHVIEQDIDAVSPPGPPGSPAALVDRSLAITAPPDSDRSAVSLLPTRNPAPRARQGQPPRSNQPRRLYQVMRPHGAPSATVDTWAVPPPRVAGTRIAAGLTRLVHLAPKPVITTSPDGRAA